jgi:kynureninase
MSSDSLSSTIAALGNGPLTEPLLSHYVFPLFSKALSPRKIYLANHSLGRPLDQVASDVAGAIALWQSKLGDAWDDWLSEREAFRVRIARLIGAPRPDCVVPKTSAGQGLRTVLNALAGKPRVVTTLCEFDSIDVVVKQYAALGRIDIRWIAANEHGYFDIEPLIAAVRAGADLVIVSHVMFMTGQIIQHLEQLASACHETGARLLVDTYHSLGVFPVDASTLGADFLIGGSYKYLRGGPGACFLYISPGVLESGIAPLDTGWFAKQDPFLYERPDPPQFASGGDAFLESTPPVVTYYQARSGQRFSLEIGISRLREYGLDRLQRLKSYLAAAGIKSSGGDAAHGAFLTIRHPKAVALVSALAAQGIECDARGSWLRLCPDCLTGDEELRTAARTLAAITV